MITDAILTACTNGVVSVINALPKFSPEVEQHLTGIPDNLADVAGFISKLSPIVPFTAIGVSAAILAVGWMAVLFFQMARAALSLVSGGGSAV